MSKLYSGAEIVFKCLKDQDVEFIFGYPGGAVLPIYDELKNHSSIKHILVRHEQGAGHAAEGYARSCGKPGVVLVTSGPGATNVVTALTDAYMDSIPLVCISGQVPTHLIGTDAFQECDTTGITRPCTKHNWLVKDIKDLSKILHKAFHVATTGRPGPVLVDIPKDIQFAKTNYSVPKKQKIINNKTPTKFTQNEIEKHNINRDSMNLIDEDLKNYNSVYKWMRDNGNADQMKLETTPEDIFTDGQLLITTSAFNPAFVIDFQQLFPVALTNLQFDATIGDVEYITAQVTFKHQQFFLRDKDFKKL